MTIRQSMGQAYFIAAQALLFVSEVIAPIERTVRAFASLPATFERIADTLDGFARYERANKMIACPACFTDWKNVEYIFPPGNKGCCGKCGIHWTAALDLIETAEQVPPVNPGPPGPPSPPRVPHHRPVG